MNFSFRAEPGKSLCHTCDNALIRMDDRNEETVLCDYTQPTIPVYRKVVTCSKYRERGRHDEYDLAKIAWVLEVEATKVIGFRPPKKKNDD